MAAANMYPSKHLCIPACLSRKRGKCLKILHCKLQLLICGVVEAVGGVIVWVLSPEDKDLRGSYTSVGQDQSTQLGFHDSFWNLSGKQDSNLVNHCLLSKATFPASARTVQSTRIQFSRSMT